MDNCYFNGDPREIPSVRINNFYGPTQYVEHADVVNPYGGADSNGAASSVAACSKQLVAYISDPVRLAEVVAVLAEVRDIQTLCRSVLWDIYNMELNDLKDKDKLIVSTPFINSLIPLLTSFEGSPSVRNIRAGIHKYILGTGNK